MKKNVILLISSILFCIALLLLGEVFCRIFLEISLVGSSKNSFTKNAFGESHGNAKNAEVEAFGVKAYTDKYGFRIDPVNPDNGEYDSAIALIGDSVSFGVGVEENKTISGLLRNRFKNIRIYNTSVSGYRVNDYKNIVNEFVIKSHISKVFLFFCLNDISYTPIVSDDEVQVDDARLKGTGTFFNILLSINKFFNLNKHLRQKSHLYHLIKNILADPSEGYFLYDLQYYSRENLLLEDDMKIMNEIKEKLNDKGIDFKIFILPYKVQLDSNKPDYMNPQKILTSYFEKYKIEHRDIFMDFIKNDIKPSKLYIFGDPLHLSEMGHKVVFDSIAGEVE